MPCCLCWLIFGIDIIGSSVLFNPSDPLAELRMCLDDLEGRRWHVLYNELCSASRLAVPYSPYPLTDMPLDVEKTISQLTLAEKIALTAGEFGYPALYEERANQLSRC